MTRNRSPRAASSVTTFIRSVKLMTASGRDSRSTRRNRLTRAILFHIADAGFADARIRSRPTRRTRGNSRYVSFSAPASVTSVTSSPASAQ
jgi:hypothetical protein